MEVVKGAAYVLSQSLLGHKQDVRSVCSVDATNEVCTTSRDTTSALWNPISGEMRQSLIGHEHFVGAVVYLPPSPYFFNDKPCIATGSNDKTIIVWDIETGAPTFTLIGHTESVVTLSHLHGKLISGSWDSTIRVWAGSQCEQELKGHTQSVWSVLGLSTGDIVSASADKTIKVWRNSQCAQTLEKHSDCVRGLAEIPQVGFLSCGNDCLIFLWSYSGDVLQSFEGHNAFIYSVAYNARTGDVLSASEDRTLKVWRDGTCEQTLMHPATVWSVCALPSGDVVTASSDGVARVWTQDDQRKASAETLELYEKSLAQQSIPSGSVGDIQMDKLPGLEALDMPGSKDQASKVVRNGNVAEAYQWSAAENRWVKVGEVVDARSSGAKQVMEGKEYDYIFDVDVGDGQSRKLGYNNSENPYTVAQQFLWREELDQGFLDQVAQFIIQNAQPITLGGDSGPGDPFTGSGRYIPGSSEMSQGSLPPFRPSPKNFPLKEPLVMSHGDPKPIGTKLSEFAAEEKLSPEQQTLLLDLLAGSQSGKLPSAAQVEPVLRQVFQWTPKHQFPVWDMLRLLVLNAAGSDLLLSLADSLIYPAMLPHLQVDSLPANQMLCLRFLVNTFRWSSWQSFILSHREEILEKAADCTSSTVRNVKVALVTLLLNFSVFFLTHKNDEGKVQCVSVLAEILNSGNNNEEVEYRALVAIGTLIWQDPDIQTLVTTLDLIPAIKKFVGSESDKSRSCAREILDIHHSS